MNIDKINDIRQLIAQDKIEDALTEIKILSRNENAEIFNEVILLEGRFTALARDIRLSTIGYENAGIQVAKLRSDCLSMLGELEKKMFKTNLIKSKQDKKIELLFLTANPPSTANLRIGKEYEEIRNVVASCDRFLLSNKWALNVSTLHDSILENNPTFIHFSGHGTQNGIVLEDEEGNENVIDGELLGGFFSNISENLKCLVLNACYSADVAAKIARHNAIPTVIGMRKLISDDAAICFSKGFYRAIAAGKKVDVAFRIAVYFMKMKRLPDADKPQLFFSKDRALDGKQGGDESSFGASVNNTGEEVFRIMQPDYKIDKQSPPSKKKSPKQPVARSQLYSELKKEIEKGYGDKEIIENALKLYPLNRRFLQEALNEIRINI